MFSVLTDCMDPQELTQSVVALLLHLLIYPVKNSDVCRYSDLQNVCNRPHRAQSSDRSFVWKITVSNLTTRLEQVLLQSESELAVPALIM